MFYFSNGTDATNRQNNLLSFVHFSILRHQQGEKSRCCEDDDELDRGDHQHQRGVDLEGDDGLCLCGGIERVTYVIPRGDAEQAAEYGAGQEDEDVAAEDIRHSPLTLCAEGVHYRNVLLLLQREQNEIESRKHKRGRNADSHCLLGYLVISKEVLGDHLISLIVVGEKPIEACHGDLFLKGVDTAVFQNVGAEHTLITVIHTARDG